SRRGSRGARAGGGADAPAGRGARDPPPSLGVGGVRSERAMAQTSSRTAPDPTLRVREGFVPLGDFHLEHGGRVEGGRIAYRLLGPPGAPVIGVLGGISADRVVAAQEGDAGRGWWEWMAGVGRPLDLRAHQVLAIDYLFGRG